MNVELHNYYQRDHNLRLDREIRYLSAIIGILNIQCLLNFVGLDIGYGLLIHVLLIIHYILFGVCMRAAGATTALIAIVLENRVMKNMLHVKSVMTCQ